MPVTQPESLTIDQLETPIGPILIAVDAQGRLRAVDFWADEVRLQRSLRLHCGPCSVTRDQAPAATRGAFARYFAGDVAALERVPWTTGGTVFQRRVWAALVTIPPGRTLSYGELARRIGEPDAVRAVGAANGANPVPIVVPCHRVIGADGTLTGFGGGLDRKRWLLHHEGADFRENRAPKRRQPGLFDGANAV